MIKLIKSRYLFLKKFSDLKITHIFLIITIGIINYGFELAGIAVFVDFLNYVILDKSYFISKLSLYFNPNIANDDEIIIISLIVILFLFLRAIFFFLNTKFKIFIFAKYYFNFLKIFIDYTCSVTESSYKTPKSLFSSNLLISSNAIIFGSLQVFCDLVVLILYSSIIISSFLYFNFIVSVFVFLFLIFILLTYKFLIFKPFIGVSDKNARFHVSVGKSLYEIMNNIKEIILNRSKTKILSNSFDTFKKFSKTHATLKNYNIYPKLFLETSFILLIIISLYLIKAVFLINSATILQNLLIFSVAGLRLVLLFINILNCTQNLKQNDSYFKEFNKIFSQYKTFVKYDKNFSKINKINLHFSYEINKNKSLLCNNVTLEKGNVYFLIGENGEGKSTFLEILSGLRDIKNYRVNDSYIKPNEIIPYISYMTQVPAIFNMSLFDNINIEGLLEEDDIKNYIKSFKLNKFSADNSLANQDLFNIASGGEKQKIAIVRALLKDKDILLFDEPTSNLDSQSESIFYNYIKKLRDKIIVIVNHDDRVRFGFDNHNIISIKKGIIEINKNN